MNKHESGNKGVMPPQGAKPEYSGLTCIIGWRTVRPGAHCRWVQRVVTPGPLDAVRTDGRTDTLVFFSLQSVGDGYLRATRKTGPGSIPAVPPHRLPQTQGILVANATASTITIRQPCECCGENYGDHASWILLEDGANRTGVISLIVARFSNLARFCAALVYHNMAPARPQLGDIPATGDYIHSHPLAKVLAFRPNLDRSRGLLTLLCRHQRLDSISLRFSIIRFAFDVHQQPRSSWHLESRVLRIYRRASTCSSDT